MGARPRQHDGADRVGQHIDHRGACRAPVRVRQGVTSGLKGCCQALYAGRELRLDVVGLTCSIAPEGRNGAARTPPVAMLTGQMRLDDLGDAQSFCQ